MKPVPKASAEQVRVNLCTNNVATGIGRSTECYLQRCSRRAIVVPGV